MNKKGLDEMQVQMRNKIGNQTFLLLMYLLLIDSGLHGFGFRWVSYPANIMIILLVSSAFYIVRLIIGNAYVGPACNTEKPVWKVVLNIAAAFVIAMAIPILLKKVNFSTSNQIDDMTAPILLITAAIFIIIVVTTAIIKKIQNRNDRE